MKISAYSEMEILADVGDLAQRNQTYVLEDMNIQNSDVMVARALIIPGESIPVHVMNPTDQPVTLYRGTRIAQLAEVEEVEDRLVMVSSVQHGTVLPELEEALYCWLKRHLLHLRNERNCFHCYWNMLMCLLFVMMSWAEQMYFNMRFILEMLRQFVSNSVECVHKRDRK